MTATPAAEPHVGIDLGTSSVKVVLLGRQGEHVAGAEASYAVRHPHAGWAESAPVDWWDATVRAVREAMSRASGTRPVSIGLSGQMHGVVATGSDGRPSGTQSCGPTRAPRSSSTSTGACPKRPVGVWRTP